MVASQATIEACPGDIALDIMGRMDALAANDEWSRIEQLAARLRSVILEVPESERHAVVVAVGHCLERVQTKALVSRGEVTDKLAEIRRGQVATRAYRQPSVRDSNAPLR